MRPRLPRPTVSYANVVATLALFVALGGSAYASGLIDGRQLRNGSVAGAKLRAHTLTGREIDLRRLGTVPRAAHASSADSATHATIADQATSASHAASADSATHALSADSATSAGNATTVGGQLPSAFLAAGGTAVDSAKLGGQLPSAFLGAGAQAADSAKLGGVAPSGYVAGGAFQPDDGNAMTPFSDSVIGGANTMLVTGMIGELQVACSDPATSGTVSYVAAAGRTVSVVSDDGAGGFHAEIVGSSGHSTPITFGAIGHVTYLITSGRTIQQISVWLQAGPTGQNLCLFRGIVLTGPKAA